MSKRSKRPTPKGAVDHLGNAVGKVRDAKCVRGHWRGPVRLDPSGLCDGQAAGTDQEQAGGRQVFFDAVQDALAEGTCKTLFGAEDQQARLAAGLAAGRPGRCSGACGTKRIGYGGGNCRGIAVDGLDLCAGGAGARGGDALHGVHDGP
jgi:hypothetical protein